MPPPESIAGLLVLLAAGALLLWAALVLWTAHRLTRPPRRTYGSAKARGWAGDPSELTPARAFEEWTLRSRGRDLPVWDIPGDEPAGPVVIFTHGWGDGRIHGLLRAPALIPHCSRLILWELPGHGDAPGACALGVAEATDLRALVEQVAGGARDADGGTPARGVVLYGFSLGAGVSIAAASGARQNQPPRHREHRENTDRPQTLHMAAVIAEAPYVLPPTPARAVLELSAMPWRTNLLPALWLVGVSLAARGLLPWSEAVRAGWLRAGGSFDRARLARGLPCPLLVLHGERDEVCPLAEAREIVEAGGGATGAADSTASATLAIIPSAGHNDVWLDDAARTAASAALSTFFHPLRATPTPPPAR